MDASMENEDADPVGEPIADGSGRRAHQGRVLRAIMDSATEDDVGEEARARLQAHQPAWSDWTGRYVAEWARLVEGRACPFQTADIAYRMWLGNKHLDPVEVARAVWDSGIELPDLPPPD